MENVIIMAQLPVLAQHSQPSTEYHYHPTRREKISKIYRKFGTYLDNVTFQ